MAVNGGGFGNTIFDPISGPSQGGLPPDLKGVIAYSALPEHHYPRNTPNFAYPTSSGSRFFDNSASVSHNSFPLSVSL